MLTQVEQQSPYLPANSAKSTSARRARKHARSDWKEIERGVPDISESQTYDQIFKNFEGTDPVEFAYSHSVTETKANEYDEYAETKTFDVSVNASIAVSDPLRSCLLPHDDCSASMKSETIRLGSLAPCSASVRACLRRKSNRSHGQRQRTARSPSKFQYLQKRAAKSPRSQSQG